MTPHTWVIGAGGLLGSAIHRAAHHTFNAPSIPWQDEQAARNTLEQSLLHFSEEIHKADTNTNTNTNTNSAARWRIIWAAGRATTSTTKADAARELALFEYFINTLIRLRPTPAGSFTLTSSAGGIYAGSLNPPFTSKTPPNPIGTYGELKLAQERATFALTERGIPTTIARISNIYGPGQDLTKLQGIVSRLCLSTITKEEVNIFVPLDTLRDYIYVDDAAARILHWSDPTNERQTSNQPHISIVASGQPMGLGSVLNTVQDVLHTRVPVSFGVHRASSAQARDLRLVPDHDAATRAMPLMPFPAGVRRVFEDLLEQRQHPQLIANSLG